MATNINSIVLCSIFFIITCSVLYGYRQCCTIAQLTDQVDVFSQRHSGRNYDSTRRVTSEQLNSLIKAAQAAPSSYNEQPWNFIICDRFTSPESFDKTLHTLVPQNQKWAQEAPVLIIVVASLHSRKGNVNKWALYDTGAAAFSMALQATILGLMAHQMGGFNATQISEFFAIPEGYMPLSVMAVGYAKNEAAAIPKHRKEIDENFFWGTWKK